MHFEVQIDPRYDGSCWVLTINRGGSLIAHVMVSTPRAAVEIAALILSDHRPATTAV